MLPILLIRGNLSSDFEFDKDSLTQLFNSLSAKPFHIPTPIVKVQSITTRTVQHDGHQARATKQTIEAELYAKEFMAAIDLKPVAKIILDFLNANKLGGCVIIGGHTFG